MKITEFKLGDIITRTDRCQVMAGDKVLHHDGSYAGDRLEFIGFEKGLIMFFDTNAAYFDRPSVLEACDGWADDNWDYFPETLYQKGVARMKEFFKKDEIKAANNQT